MSCEPKPKLPRMALQQKNNWKTRDAFVNE
jgi:hypothetical protein